jgi:protein gp37
MIDKLPTVKGLNNVSESIEWADYTWNPVTGCERISAGCKHCYAHSVHARFNKGVPFSRIQFHPERLQAPLKLKRPSIIFVGSMTDVFHKDVSFHRIDEIVAKAWSAPQHTYMMLTKRPDRMKEYFESRKGMDNMGDCINSDLLLQGFAGNDIRGDEIDTDKPPGNLFLGVTAENQEMSDARIPVLLSIPAAGHFISAEPMLSGIDVEQYLGEPYWYCPNCDREVHSARVTYEEIHDGCGHEVETRGGIDLVICGKENGAGARPCDPAWVIDLYEQCKSANVKFFAKNGMPNGVPAEILKCKERMDNA